MKKTIRVLIIGDVVGNTGQTMFQKHIGQLQEKHSIDFTIVNGENSNSNGRGITSRIVKFFKHNGVDVVTSGNHIWNQNEIRTYLQDHTDLLRPANFPSVCPGVGVTVADCAGIPVGVINVQGRVFMREQLDCPFKTVDSILKYLQDKTKIIIVDFHAEATAEKMGMGLYLDGRVSLVVGTHTHTQTADQRVLPKGTAFITDLGMVGSLNSMIGMKPESVLPTFLTQMPSRFAVDTRPPVVMSGIWADIDVATGKAVSIHPVRVIDEILSLEEKQ